MKTTFIALTLSLFSLSPIGASAQEIYPVRQVEDLPSVVLIDDESAMELAAAINSKNPSPAQVTKIIDVLSKLSKSEYCKITANHYMKVYRESERSYQADERAHVVGKMEATCRSIMPDPDLVVAAVRFNSEKNPGTPVTAEWIQKFISGMVALMQLMPH